MRKINKFISLLLILCMMPLTVFAEDTYTPEETEQSESVTVNNAIYDIDNSELNVKVVHNSKDGKEIIFTGKLKDYENGKWIHLDFSQVQFWAIFQWEGQSDESRYIIPIENEFENGDTIEPPEETDDLLSANSSVNAESSIKCDVNLMYDGAYSERVMIKNKQLNVPVKITNTAGNPKSVICFLAEYGEKGELLDSVSSSSFTVEAGKTVETNIIKTFSQQAKTARIFIWDNETMQPATGAITLDENESDYYADKLDDAGFYDINYQIKGKINTVNDVDYIKFIPETSGTYTIKCISATDIQTSLYRENYGSVKTNFTSGRCWLYEGKVYYMKTDGSTGEYILSIQSGLPSEAENFSIYDFDTDTNVYKKSILNMCRDLWYEDDEKSKQMYDEYENILKQETRLHRLPEFLSGHPKDLDNFDEIVNQYYSTKYKDLDAVRQQYLDLIDKYTKPETEEVQTYSIEADNTENNEFPIIGKYYPEVYSTEGIEDTEKPNLELDAAVPNAAPALTIMETTSTSITYNATFPTSGAKGNAVYIIDFNKASGLTAERNASGENAIHKLSGRYTINGLQPGGIYILEILWSTDGGESYGGDNSICRFVQLPCETEETLYMYDNGGRVSANIEPADRGLASERNFNEWLDRMDKTYAALRELTGYTPYNAQKIIMKSTRDNINNYMGIQDGKNYWWVVFGYYDHTRIFKHSKAFTRGHMRRLSQGDWGDTPMHELSHTFDYYSWDFDSETLAQLKLYYAVSQLNAKIYRPDRFNNKGNGWYTGTNYYTLLKTDRYLDSYVNSFDKGNYKSEGFAAILIEIQKEIGWEPFKKTFRYFSDLKNNQVPYPDGEKLKLFLTKLKDYSGKDVLSYISSRDQNIINNHYGITLEYVTSAIPITDDGETAAVTAESGGYALYTFVPESSGNYYVYTSP